MNYTEVEKFNPAIMWAVRALMIGTIIVALYAVPPQDEAIATSILIGALAIWIFLESIQLTVHVTRDEISFKLRPLTSKSFSRSDVSEAKVIDYGFVGGYGIRLTRKYGTVYNVSGSKGIKLTLKSGKTLVIGVQDAKKAQAAVDGFMSS